jgi:hypothetical protein
MEPRGYGPVPPYLRPSNPREEAAEFFERNRQPGEERDAKIDRGSPTWKAVKAYIARQVADNYMPMLKNRGVSHDDTQYARGGVEALESLLEFAGESNV